MTQSPPPSQLDYEFDTSPELGDSTEIAPGLRWLRMPLPFLLGHINLWLMQDGESWTVVDTGLFTRSSRETWHQVLSTQIQSGPVSRVIVTHLHPDHVGCAGWLTRECDAELWMSRSEYLLCRILVDDTGKPAPPEGVDFYAQAGFEEQSLARYEASFGSFGKVVSPLPLTYNRLADGQRLSIGDLTWEVMVGRGHSVEHACLYCAELNTLISGDQILPTISSNVSVFPTEPNANPLRDWLDSLAMLKQKLPADVLVLPAHGRPFRGAHHRLDELTQEHLQGLDKLSQACKEPMRAVDTYQLLFNSKITESNQIMAAGEAIAHLHFLQEQGLIHSWLDDSRVRWYQLRA